MEQIETAVECTISPEHIDENNHLSHEYYPIYFNEGRKALYKAYGVDNKELREKIGVEFLVHKATYRFRGPVTAYQTVEIKSKIKPYKKTPIRLIEHRMYLDDDLMAVAIVKHFFKDIKTGKPITDLSDKRLEKIL